MYGFKKDVWFFSKVLKIKKIKNKKIKKIKKVGGKPYTTIHNYTLINNKQKK